MRDLGSASAQICCLSSAGRRRNLGKVVGDPLGRGRMREEEWIGIREEEGWFGLRVQRRRSSECSWQAS